MGPGRGSPGSGPRVRPLHKVWLSGLLLLEPYGAHLLGQRSLQMAMEMDVSGRNEEDEGKSNSTMWDTFTCF